MKVAGLFAGVGGIELGLAKAGHRTDAVSEVWLPACAVLRTRIDAPNLGDVRTIASLPRVDLLTAGFPCQDLSQAGITAGIGGERSGLVQSVFALLDKQPTDWVLLENVSFMLRLDGGTAMRTIVEAFEERGYRWAYRVVNSLSFVPQRRERVFFLASRSGDPAAVLLVDEHAPWTVQTTFDDHAHGFYWTEGVRGLGWGADCVPTLKNGSTVGIASPPAMLRPSGTVETPDIRDAERLQGFEPGWTEPAGEVGRDSWRWSLVGNAVTVPVAAWLGGRLAEPGVYDLSRDRPLTGGWPRSARFDGRGRRAVEINDRVGPGPSLGLERFLRFQGKPLSVRATEGFLSRTARSSLRFKPGFLDRIAAHADAMRGDLPKAA